MYQKVNKQVNSIKKCTTIFLLAVALSNAAFAQSEKYIAAMGKNLAMMENSFKSNADLLTLANSFERIATAEKTQWLPYYYAAFCQVNIGFREEDKDKIDAIADKANALIMIADSLSPNNSEISCIKSMVATCHMMVNPMQRWQQYGMASSTSIATAIKQNPDNPRPYYLRGQSLKYTPENFGGGCKNALPVLEQSLAKYNAFKPATEMEPNWGKAELEKVIKECN
jgi:hypothetical protein